MTNSTANGLSRDEAFDLIQNRYYRGTDTNDPQLCADSLSENVEWTHQSAWAGEEIGLGSGVDVFDSREAVLKFLTHSLAGAHERGLLHTVREFVYDETQQRGAFIAETSSSKDDRVEPFLVWFAIRDRLISRYLMRPL